MKILIIRRSNVLKKCEKDIEVLKVQVEVLQKVTAYLISHHGVPFRKEHIKKLREICSGKLEWNTKK